MTTLPERLLARARKLEAVRDMLGIPACDYADQPHIDMLREAATALQPSAGGDFHDVLFGAKVELLLTPGGSEESTVEATVGATFGPEDDLRILIHAGTNAEPIDLYLASPAQPSGFVLVPEKITEAMCDACHNVPSGFAGSPPHPQHIWDAMLTAAPVLPTITMYGIAE